MGDYVSLGADVDCYSMALITLGTKASVSQRTFLCTGSHDIHTQERNLVIAPIVIGEFAWVAAECMVLPGVKIGKGAVIGARSVVVRDIPEWTVSAGHPCIPLRARIINTKEVRSD
jgi:putative colanic acid biosynthesis acetyltransferase WcaF